MQNCFLFFSIKYSNKGLNSFTARGVVMFVPGGESGQVAFSEVNMGEKKLGDIKTRNLYVKQKLIVLRVQ